MGSILVGRAGGPNAGWQKMGASGPFLGGRGAGPDSRWQGRGSSFPGWKAQSKKAGVVQWVLFRPGDAGRDAIWADRGWSGSDLGHLYCLREQVNGQAQSNLAPSHRPAHQPSRARSER